MIREVYHPKFSDDIYFLYQTLGDTRSKECLIQIDKAINQVLWNPYKAALLRYPPLQGYRKKKFFSVARPQKQQRPDMRLLYRYDTQYNILYFLGVGFRINMKPHSQEDVYQRTKNRDLHDWG